MSFEINVCNLQVAFSEASLAALFSKYCSLSFYQTVFVNFLKSLVPRVIRIHENLNFILNAIF